jgi:hypothetical protein
MDDNNFNAAQAFQDIELVAELRRVATEIDSVPDQVLAAARAAIITRDLDGELAVLVADSAADDGSESDVTSLPLAFEPVRTETAEYQGSRMLSFASSGVQVDLEVSERGDRLDLIGQLTGASAEGCVLELATGEQYPIDVDGLGRFLVSGVQRGPIRARCRSVAGGQVITAWVTI